MIALKCAMDKVKRGPLPAGYRVIKATRLRSDYSVKCGFSVPVKWSQVSAVRIMFAVPQDYTYMMFVTSVADRVNWSPAAPYLGKGVTVNGSNLAISPNSLTTDKVLFNLDGSINDVTITVTSTSDRFVGFGAWSDATWTHTGDWYGAELSGANGETLSRLVPCVRKNDDRVGFYDVINDEFVTSDIGSIYEEVI